MQRVITEWTMKRQWHAAPDHLLEHVNKKVNNTSNTSNSLNVINSATHFVSHRFIINCRKIFEPNVCQDSQPWISLLETVCPFSNSSAWLSPLPQNYFFNELTSFCNFLRIFKAENPERGKPRFCCRLEWNGSFLQDLAAVDMHLIICCTDNTGRQVVVFLHMHTRSPV